MEKRYRLQKEGRTITSVIPGEYAGWRTGKIFGRLDCASGKRLIRPENRVFFATIEDAVREGYRPCQKCRPMDEKEFGDVRHLVPYSTLDEFYNRDKRPKR